MTLKLNLKDPITADAVNRALLQVYQELAPSASRVAVTRVPASAGGYSAQLTDEVVEVTGAGNLRIALPLAGAARNLLVITQQGTASVQAVGGQISGRSMVSMGANSSLRLFYDGDGWWL